MKIQGTTQAITVQKKQPTPTAEKVKIAATTASIAAAAGTGVYLVKSGKAAKAFETTKNAIGNASKKVAEKAKPVIDKIKNSKFAQHVKAFFIKAKAFVQDKFARLRDSVGKFDPKFATPESKMAETFNNFVK